MILHAPHLVLSLRWIPPCAVIIGCSPLYLVKWSAVKLLTFPLPRRAFVWLEDLLLSNYSALVGFFYETWSGVEFCFYGDQIPDKPENVLYMSNHQCSLDWVIPEVMCLKQGRGGRVRYILKDTIKYLPLYGWYLGKRGSVFVKRGQDKDAQAIVEGLRRYVKNDVPVWLVIFPEGTRYRPNRLQASRDFSRRSGQQELSHVLFPRTKGFEMALDHAGHHFSAVYDVTLYYEAVNQRQRQVSGGRDRLPNLFNFFTGVCCRVHVHIKRTDVEDIPKDSEGRKEWLHSAFVQKDVLLKEVIAHGNFSGPRVPCGLLPHYSLLSVALFTGSVVLAWSSRQGRRLYVSSLAFFTLVTLVSALLS